MSTPDISTHAPSRPQPWRVLALMVLFCAACGVEDSSEPSALETRTAELNDRVCGANKYEGPQGVDISVYQGDFDFAARKNEGIVFGIARLSHGLAEPDPNLEGPGTPGLDDKFDRNWTEMKDQGVLRGAYQYFRPAQDAAEQAELMVEKLGVLGEGDLPAAIDVEADDGFSPGEMQAKVQTWLDIVEAGTGKKPIIYSYPSFWQNYVGEHEFQDYPLWIANYDVDCPIAIGWSKWTIWQYCDGNPDYCTNGEGYDRNVFNGTLEELQRFAGPSLAATVTDSNIGEEHTLAPGSTAVIFVEVRNDGQTTWNDSTRLGTASPRDGESVFEDESWHSSNRPVAHSGETDPDGSYRFEFTIKAPEEPGEYTERFEFVHEGLTWFDEVGQGGPSADELALTIRVQQGVDPSDPDPADPDPSDPDPSDPEGPLDDGEFPELISPSSGEAAGCSSSSSDRSPSCLSLFLALFGLGLIRRI